MAAFFIAGIQLGNPASRPLYDAYIEKVRPIVERHGGRYRCGPNGLRILPETGVRTG